MKKPIVKIAISGLLFVAIFWRIDSTEVLASLRMLNLWFVPLVLLLIIANYIISAVRWKSLIIFENSEKTSIAYLTNLYFIGAFFNNFLPTSVGGDAYKIYRLGKRLGNTVNAFVATFMERFTGFVALIIISYFGIVATFDFLVTQLPSTISGNSLYVQIVKFMIFFGFWIASIASFFALRFFSTKHKKLGEIYTALLTYRNNFGVLAWAMITSFGVQFLAIFSQYFVFKALGVELTLEYALFVFPVVTLASFFIPSLNGVGVQDLLYMELFALLGVAPAVALSASIIYHLSRLAVSLIGGVLYAITPADT